LDGAISDPFPLQRLDGHKVLAIRTTGSPLDPKGSFFNYISQVINCLTSQKRNEKFSKNTKILDLVFEINDAIGVNLNLEKRVDMVLIGYLRSYQFIKSITEKEFPENYSYLETIEKITSSAFFDSLLVKPSVKQITETKPTMPQIPEEEKDVPSAKEESKYVTEHVIPERIQSTRQARITVKDNSHRVKSVQRNRL
jgi:hypothetical protein